MGVSINQAEVCGDAPAALHYEVGVSINQTEVCGDAPPTLTFVLFETDLLGECRPNNKAFCCPSTKKQEVGPKAVLSEPTLCFKPLPSLSPP